MATTAPIAAPAEMEHPRRRPVFISDFVHIAAPYAEILPVLLDPKGEWLLRLHGGTSAGPLGVDGTGPRAVSEGVFVLQMDIGPSARTATAPVHLRVGPPRRAVDCVICPVSWTPDVWPPVLPDLDADLQLTKLDEDGTTCRLGLQGSYPVPLAGFGRAVDKLALHRVAEATIRRFLVEASEALVSQ